MSIWRDLRYAVRSLRRAPGFTAVTVVVLAAGIGANSAMFSLVDAALVRPLPFTQSDRLVMLWERSTRFAHNRVSPLNFLDWSEQQHAFSAVAAVAGGSRTLTGNGGDAERIPGQAVTWQFFDLFGIRPIAGATFTADDAANRRMLVVLSERLWRNRFGGDPAIVGRAITLDGQPYTVAGIVPASFQVLYNADMWTLFAVRRSPEQRRQHYMQVIGRLKPGTTLEQAKADMAGRSRSDRDHRTGDQQGLGRDHRAASRCDRRTGAADDVAGARGGRRIRAADGVRERRQPAAGARPRPLARNGRARRARRQPPAHRAATAHRKSAAGGARRKRRPGAGVGRGSGRAVADSGGHAAGGDRARVRRPGRRCRRAAHCGYRAALRVGTGVASVNRPAGGGDRVGRPRIDQNRRTRCARRWSSARSRRRCCWWPAPACSSVR